MAGKEETKKRAHFFSLKNKRNLSAIVYLALGFMVWLLRRTLRLTIHDPHNFLAVDNPRPFIGALWHNRLLITPVTLPRRKRRMMAILASDSRDGEYAARYMRFFGFRVVRGSSSKGGAKAVRLLKRELKRGFSVALTPDGPRGPRYQVQPGVVALSQMTGRPVVPVILNGFRRWELKGWDRTQIPKPFSRVELILGEPITVPPETTEEGRKEWLAEVQRRMMAITRD